MIPDEPNDQLEKRMHGIDERITVKNLVYGTSVLYETVKRFMSLGRHRSFFGAVRFSIAT